MGLTSFRSTAGSVQQRPTMATRLVRHVARRVQGARRRFCSRSYPQYPRCVALELCAVSFDDCPLHFCPHLRFGLRVAVAATLLSCQGADETPQVLLAKRGKDPHKGMWSLPGGAVELGETISAAGAREIKEETTLDINPSRAFRTTDSVHLDDDGKVQYHYIIAHVAAAVPGVPKVTPQGDVDALAWVPVTDLREIEDLSEGTWDVVLSATEHLVLKGESLDEDLFNSLFVFFGRCDTTSSEVSNLI